MKKINKGLSKNRVTGFTIVEMIVAVAVFSVVMTISLGVFLNINDILNRARAFRAANDSLSFAIDAMAREIALGVDYKNSSDFPVPFTDEGEIRFTGAFDEDNESGRSIIYRLNNGSIERRLDNTGVFLPLTAPEVLVDKLIFIARGGADVQPSVTIVVGGWTGAKETTKVPFNLQTTVSQRSLIKNP